MSTILTAAGSNSAASRIDVAGLQGGPRRIGGRGRIAFRKARRTKTIICSTSETPTKTETMRALITVFDKRAVVEFAQALQAMGVTIVSTGGTAQKLAGEGVAVSKVEDLTGFPEILDGRVKTLHPNVHGGILARRDLASHTEALEKHRIPPIDIVVVNLYPFRETVSGSQGAGFQECIENIDIGGPALLRAAAKNHKDVLVVVNPDDYDNIIEEMKKSDGGIPADSPLRLKLAWSAFQHVATYDSTVAEWMWSQMSFESEEEKVQQVGLSIPISLSSSLRYGENPHQKAGFYVDQSLREVSRGGIAKSLQHHGKEMSYNNYLDADAAWAAVCDFPDPTCLIVKHTNPCGVASRDDLLEAYRLAVKADATSAFGGIVAFNRTVTEELAQEIREFRSPNDNETRMFYEIVVAPEYTASGLEVLKGKSKNLRILQAPIHTQDGLSVRQIGGGWLIQQSDAVAPEEMNLNVVTETQPPAELMADAKFAWRCVKHVKSNAIVLAKDEKMLGMGSGQPNRIKSVEIAMEKAGGDLVGSVLASDAFFPFAWGDAVEKACQEGVKVIIQPGGSMRDQDAVDCCNKYGVAMIMTGYRHFRH